MENQEIENNKFCTTCGIEKQELELYIMTAPCWSCSKDIKIAFMRGVECDIVREISNNLAPTYFKENERILAQSKGADIRNMYSNSVDEFYYVNTCPHCENIMGNNYLFTQYISPAINTNEYTYETYNLGYCCDNCDNNTVMEANGFL